MFCWPSQKLITNLLLNLLRIPDSAKFDASHQQNVKSEKQEIIYDVEYIGWIGCSYPTLAFIWLRISSLFLYESMNFKTFLKKYSFGIRSELVSF